MPGTCVVEVCLVRATLFLVAGSVIQKPDGDCAVGSRFVLWRSRSW